MQGTPYTFVDGVIEKVGAFDGGSGCNGDSSGCTYQYFMGNDSTECSLRNNQGVADRLPKVSPLSVAISSSFNDDTLSGTFTVTVSLDGSIAPAAGSINLVTVVLYERGVKSSYGKDPIHYAQVARKSLLTGEVTATEAGQQQTFTVDYLLDPSWVPENMGVLAFVQNYLGTPSTAPNKLQPKEIYNSGFLDNILKTPHSRPVSKP